ncbi:YbjQ family protein [Microbacterium sp. W1N]|uniref:YbjQ family protein n=1 Tax=Microbacterium festucae TaxID=2977531 RepID=UPI0021C1DFBB|nr:YbjQ family protein [Microbacterium festucae]MCT9819703.1 YbjQ family protein [Microbacterium festucae]
MLIVTTNDIPGKTVTTVLGEVFGLTVRSRNIGSNIGASFKALAGGELKGITTLLHGAREEALKRLWAEAEQKGANAVLAFRFETNDYNGAGVEVCAYGTAVVVA